MQPHNDSQQKQDKIFIYDNLLSNDSPIRTFNTDDEYQESEESSYMLEKSNCQQIIKSDDQCPLYTIYEGGSSVSSGRSSLQSIADSSQPNFAMTTTQFLKTDHDYHNYNQQLYLQTSTSQKSASHQNRQFYNTTKTPLREITKLNLGAVTTGHNSNSNNKFGSAERVNRGSSRYRYDAREDEDDEQQVDDEEYYYDINGRETVQREIPDAPIEKITRYSNINFNENSGNVESDAEDVLSRIIQNNTGIINLSQQTSCGVNKPSHSLISRNQRKDSNDSDSTVMDDTAILEEISEAKQIVGPCQRNVFVNKPPLSQQQPQLKGDPDEEEQQMLQSTNSLEFRDPETNKIFLRTSMEQAKRHIRKISQIIIDEQQLVNQKNQVPQSEISSMEQGNTEESEVPDTDRSQIAGQRMSIIKSILQKMLTMQNGKNIAQWTQHEMLALTDIFKNIVHDEITKTKSPERRQVNSTLISDKENVSMVSQLEQQNRDMAMEIEALRSELQRTKPLSGVRTPQSTNYNSQACKPQLQYIANITPQTTKNSSAQVLKSQGGHRPLQSTSKPLNPVLASKASQQSSQKPKPSQKSVEKSKLKLNFDFSASRPKAASTFNSQKGSFVGDRNSQSQTKHLTTTSSTTVQSKAVSRRQSTVSQLSSNKRMGPQTGSLYKPKMVSSFLRQ